METLGHCVFKKFSTFQLFKPYILTRMRRSKWITLGEQNLAAKPGETAIFCKGEDNNGDEFLHV